MVVLHSRITLAYKRGTRKFGFLFVSKGYYHFLFSDACVSGDFMPVEYCKWFGDDDEEEGGEGDTFPGSKSTGVDECKLSASEAMRVLMELSSLFCSKGSICLR